MTYLGCDWYMENYIIAETKEAYRLGSFWYCWWYRDLLSAKDGDHRIVGSGWEIMDSESV